MSSKWQVGRHPSRSSARSWNPPNGWSFATKASIIFKMNRPNTRRFSRSSALNHPNSLKALRWTAGEGVMREVALVRTPIAAPCPLCHSEPSRFLCSWIKKLLRVRMKMSIIKVSHLTWVRNNRERPKTPSWSKGMATIWSNSKSPIIFKRSKNEARFQSKRVHTPTSRWLMTRSRVISRCPRHR